MSEVEAVLNAGRKALESQDATFAMVLKAMANGVEPEQPKAPKAPSAIPMTDELVHALGVLHAVFGQVNPTEVRVLTDEENALLLEENRTLDAIVKALVKRLEDTKVIARNHMHMTAVAEGHAGPNAEVDQQGHVLVAKPQEPYQVPVPSTDKAWSLQYVAPRVDIDQTRLEQLRAERHDEWLALTRQVRVFDENKALDSIRKNPGLLKTVQELIKRGRPSTALYVRKQK